jgi:hypothetical protein
VAGVLALVLLAVIVALLTVLAVAALALWTGGRSLRIVEPAASGAAPAPAESSGGPRRSSDAH